MKTDRNWWSEATRKARMAPQQQMAAAMGAAATVEYLAARLRGRVGREIVNQIQFGAAAPLQRTHVDRTTPRRGEKSESPVRQGAQTAPHFSRNTKEEQIVWLTS